MTTDGVQTQVEPSAAVRRWDYHVCNVHARHIEALEEHLKELGRDGWELVYMYSPIATEYQCVLRRPLD